MELFNILLVLSMAALGFMTTKTSSHPNMLFDVTKYGAVGDGETDDSFAFLKAWKASCGGASNTNNVLLVPASNTFLLNSLVFKGPCTCPSITLQIEGKIIAPSKIRDWRKSDEIQGWISFHGVKGLTVTGNGIIDGQGFEWWRLCRKWGKKKCNKRPTALGFHHCEELILSGLKHYNSQRNHISINKCNGVTLSALQIVAPQTSPNTDGIDISSSVNVVIQNSSIATGDDCIAINNNCSNINITGIVCGPGHGISVGSLGTNGQSVAVEEIHVFNCTFNGTKNGARIKTWQGGSGYARKISFDHIKLIAAERPIIIDQFYSDFVNTEGEGEGEGGSSSGAGAGEGVKISNVSYTNFRGTSRSEDAIELKCCERLGCSNIVMDHIHITSAADSGDKTYASCVNAHAISYDTIPNLHCSHSHSHSHSQ